MVDIRNIGKSAIAVFLDGEELKKRNIEAGNIGLEQAAELVKTAGWEMAEFEIFAGRDSVLLFAWEKPSTPYCFEFESVERVISAASECPKDMASKLIYDGSHYILTVYTAKDELPCASLYEFGDALDISEEYVLHLLEHCDLIIESNAIEVLRAL